MVYHIRCLFCPPNLCFCSLRGVLVPIQSSKLPTQACGRMACRSLCYRSPGDGPIVWKRPKSWPNQFLVSGWPTPLKNMSSSVGMMTFPIYGKKNVPNHQPDLMSIPTHYLNLVRISWTRKQELAPILYHNQPPTGGFDLSQRYESILQLRLTALSAVITLHVHLPCLKSSSDIFSKCKSP